MYTGKNPIAIRSQECFVESLLELMKSKSLFKITIKDICEKANLSRQTFYQLFSTKEDVLRFYIKRSFEEIYPDSKIEYHENVKLIAQYFLKFLMENDDFVKILVENRIAYLIVDELAMSIRNIGNKANIDNKKENNEYAVAFIAGGISSTIFYWLKSDKKISEEKLIDLIAKMSIIK